MKKILISVVFMLFAIPVYSADWQFDSTGSFEIDKNSILKTKNSVKAWARFEKKGRYMYVKKYTMGKSYLEVNCQDRTISYLYTAFYNKKGKLIGYYDFEKENNVFYDRIIPDSQGEMIYKELCPYLRKR